MLAERVFAVAMHLAYDSHNTIRVWNARFKWPGRGYSTPCSDSYVQTILTFDNFRYTRSWMVCFYKRRRADCLLCRTLFFMVGNKRNTLETVRQTPPLIIRVEHHHFRYFMAVVVVVGRRELLRLKCSCPAFCNRRRWNAQETLLPPFTECKHSTWFMWLI